MRATLITVVSFLGAFAVGWATAPAPAECRQCNAKKCFHDSSCGRLCTCVFEGGKQSKKGVCMQIGDGD